MSDGPIEGVELETVSLRTLDLLSNGAVGQAVKRELEVAVGDLIGHGNDGKVRKLIVVVKMKKTRDNRYELAVEVDHDLPKIKGNKTMAVAFAASRKDPRLFFNPESAAHPGQMTITSSAWEGAAAQ